MRSRRKPVCSSDWPSAAASRSWRASGGRSSPAAAGGVARRHDRPAQSVGAQRRGHRGQGGGRPRAGARGPSCRRSLATSKRASLAASPSPSPASASSPRRWANRTPPPPTTPNALRAANASGRRGRDRPGTRGRRQWQCRRTAGAGGDAARRRFEAVVRRRPSSGAIAPTSKRLRITPAERSVRRPFAAAAYELGTTLDTAAAVDLAGTHSPTTVASSIDAVT